MANLSNSDDQSLPYVSGMKRWFLRPLAQLRTFFRRLVIAVGEEYWNGLLTLQAMALVYTTLLSLVPFLAVVFSVLKAFGAQHQIEPSLVQALAPLGKQGEIIARRLVEFVNNLQVGVLGALGLAGLFFSVFSIMSQIENALNYLWRVRRARSFARRFSDYFSLALAGPVLVFTAFALTASAQSYWLTQQMLAMPSIGSVVTVVTKVMPFIFLCTAFTALYKLIPYTQVSFAAAFIGGVAAGLLWQLTGAAFTAFVVSSVYYKTIYSSFAILIVFLLWLYIGWLIILVGGEVAYIYQHPYAYRTQASWQRRGYVFRTWLALSTLAEITRRYLEEETPWRLAEISARLNVSTAALEELTTEFVRYGLLCRAAEPDGIVLGRPPEQVTISELLDLLDGSDFAGVESSAESDDPIAHLLSRRRELLQEEFAGITLRSLVALMSAQDSAGNGEPCAPAALFPSSPPTTEGDRGVSERAKQ